MKVAVLRFSALGDVAMTVPVLWSAARQNAGAEFVVVTRRPFCALYEDLAANISTYGCDLHSTHQGILGMWRLAGELKALGVDTVADLHDVLRTKMLRFFMRLHGCRVSRINKGRAEKRLLVKNGWKRSEPLRPQTERYADVFRHLGLRCEPAFDKLPLPRADGLPQKPDGARWIGVAPAAAHTAKAYPAERLHTALVSLLEEPGVSLFFFGIEQSVKAEAESLAKQYSGRVFHASQFARGLRAELALMGRLDVMLTMDSANMHLAALVGLKTFSIWGATHPWAGFLGYGQSETDCIQSPRDCRPCTIYGAHPRCKAPYPCLQDITPEAVRKSVEH